MDTSFLIRLLKRDEKLHPSAREYYQYFLEKNHPLFVSTIAIAEYCVRGHVSELPLKNLRILPFNLDHSIVAGPFARVLFENRQAFLNDQDRKIIPNDVKLMAQAHQESQIGFFASADLRATTVHKLLVDNCQARFKFLDISISRAQAFSELDFGIGEEL